MHLIFELVTRFNWIEIAETYVLGLPAPRDYVANMRLIENLSHIVQHHAQDYAQYENFQRTRMGGYIFSGQFTRYPPRVVPLVVCLKILNLDVFCGSNAEALEFSRLAMRELTNYTGLNQAIANRSDVTDLHLFMVGAKATEHYRHLEESIPIPNPADPETVVDFTNNFKAHTNLQNVAKYSLEIYKDEITLITANERLSSLIE